MYTAIIVEPRKHAAFSYVLNNILTNLSADWNIVVCHGNKNADFVKMGFKNNSRITFVNLGSDNFDYAEYAKLWTTRSFYDNIPTEMFLKFETDSIIISKNAHLINEFLEYDYVGAPWVDGQIGNGGFSLRRKSKMLELIDKVPYIDGEGEDLFFSQWLHRVNNDFSIHVHKPSLEDSNRFSVETVAYPEPLGCHKPWEYVPEFVKLHPEVQILQSLQFSMV